MHRAPQGIALAQGFIPTEMSFIVALPSSAGGGFDRLSRNAALTAELDQRFDIRAVLINCQHGEVVRKQYCIEGESLEAVQAKPILNFALRSCILFNNDSGLGGGG